MPSGLQLGRHALAGLLHGAAHVDDAPQRARRRCGRCRGNAGAPWRCSLFAARQLRRGLGRRASAWPTGGASPRSSSASVTLSGGSRRTTLSPAPTVSSFSRHAGVDHVAHRRLDLDAGQQAAAAHLLDDIGVLVLEARQLLLEAQRHGLHVLEEARLQHGLEHGIADRHGQRIAAEGRAVRAGHHALGRLLGGEHGAERKAAADALGDRHHVGRDARPLVREQLAGAAHAASAPRRAPAAGRACRTARAAP